MAEDFIKYAFIAGELSPTLYGRTDLEKHDLGLALARNWYIDFRGGISTRPGLQFGDFIEEDADSPARMIPFKFAPNLFNTYIILLTDQKIRFIQDNAYVLENDVNASAITQANPGVVTANSHGFSDEDWVICTDGGGMDELVNRVFVVTAKTTNNFTLFDVFGNPVNTTNYEAVTGTPTFARVYTVASPYVAAHLSSLRAYQINDTVRLTHPDYPIYNLVRNDHADWDLEEEVIGDDSTVPGAPTLAASTAGSAGIGVRVTAYIDGKESRASPMTIITNSVNYADTAGSLKITWTAVSGASHYSVYRTTIVPAGADMSRSEAVGWIGDAYGPIFIDANILPDFTRTPPQHRNPFANGAVTHAEVTNQGASHTQASAVSFDASPTGDTATGEAIVNGGLLLGVRVTYSGSGYTTAPACAVSIGTGEAVTVTLGELSGNYPAVSCVFQQRQLYAASYNQPLTLWGSRPGRLSSFDESQVVNAADSYQFDIVSEEVTPIKHMIPQRAGLVLMSNSGVWQLASGSGNSAAVTPVDALADPQSYAGVSDVPPLTVDTDILFIETNGTAVRLMEYNDYSKVYASKNLSVLANHLLTPTKYMTQWAFASHPYKLVWGRRNDGALLAFTILKEEKVFAWSQHWTKGLFQDVVTVKENNIDVVYCIVKRKINGVWCKTFERMASREFLDVEDAWCLDCALTTELETFPETLQADGPGVAGETVTFSASVGGWAGGDVGAILRMGGGKFRVATCNDTTFTAVCLRPITSTLPEDPDEIPLPFVEGEWTYAQPFTVVTGLWHLEGEEVVVLADGSVVTGLTVEDGQITLPSEATLVIVGLPYTCIAKTLPPSTQRDVVEDNRKRVVGSAVRINETRGLKVGATLDTLYPMKERTDELIGQPTRLQSGVKYVTIQAAFDIEGQTYYVQDSPLPATVLGFVEQTDVGDTDDPRRD